MKNIDYSFNKVGSLTGYNDSISSATYQYDDLQRRIGETVNYPGFSLSTSFSYYANSRKKSYTDPAGRVRTWSYDEAGRPTGINLGSAGEVSTNSFIWNSPAKMTLPGGSTLNYGYNGLQQPTAISHQDPGKNPVIDYSYTYSLNGQVSAKNTEHGNYAYGYDLVNRLNSVDSPADDEAYTYDPLGNRLTSTEHNNWVYDDNNRLESFGVTTFNYDAYGNLTLKTVAGVNSNFVYTVDNRLQRVEDGGGSPIASYYYDPFGRRLWKDVAGSRTFFHYNDEGLVGEYNASGVEQRTYGYHTGSSWSSNPLFVQEGGVYYWYQNDHLGTPQKIIAENGAVVWSARYDGFGGAVVGVETVVNHLRFPGQYHDSETGLHYNWHRYYDPATGRYISADPIGLDGGINLYAYVGGNSINAVDPWGLTEWDGGSNPAPVGRPPLTSCPAKEDDIKSNPKFSPYASPGNKKREYGQNNFHCGFNCYLEKNVASRYQQQECCYDKCGDLVTSGGCQGSPNTYNGDGNKLDQLLHTFLDPGGLLRAGPAGWSASHASPSGAELNGP